MYNDTLRRLGDAITRKRPEKIEHQQLVFPSRQCSRTLVGFGQVFPVKNNVTTLRHPPYLPDLTPVVFTCFLDWNEH
jgi:hypothetical protein